MQITQLAIEGVYMLEPHVFDDERGFFFESYNQKVFADAIGYTPQFVQDNHSKSNRGVLRGLHFQLPPHAQGKLVRVISGEIFDVAVDLRQDSSTFGQWVSVVLTAENKKQLWIPEGFAHGFVSLTDETEVLYKTTDFYCSSSEASIRWDDPTVSIDWPMMDDMHLSTKDASASFLKDAISLLPDGSWGDNNA